MVLPSKYIETQPTCFYRGGKYISRDLFSFAEIRPKKGEGEKKKDFGKKRTSFTWRGCGTDPGGLVAGNYILKEGKSGGKNVGESEGSSPGGKPISIH